MTLNAPNNQQARTCKYEHYFIQGREWLREIKKIASKWITYYNVQCTHSNKHIEAGSEERQRTNTTHSSNAPLTEEEENIKNDALGNALIEAVGHNYHNSEELRVASQRRKLQEDLLYFNSYLDRFKTPDKNLLRKNLFLI